MNEEQEIFSPYYQSGLRPKLTAGCDRMLFTYTLLGVVAINYVCFTNIGTNGWFAAFCAGSMLLFGRLVKLYRSMAASDPDLVRVYLWNRHYSPFYRAESNR